MKLSMGFLIIFNLAFIACLVLALKAPTMLEAKICLGGAIVAAIGSLFCSNTLFSYITNKDSK